MDEARGPLSVPSRSFSSFLLFSMRATVACVAAGAARRAARSGRGRSFCGKRLAEGVEKRVCEDVYGSKRCCCAWEA